MPLKRETHRIAGALFWRGPVLTLQPMRNLHMVTTVYRALTLLLALSTCCDPATPSLAGCLLSLQRSA